MDRKKFFENLCFPVGVVGRQAKQTFGIGGPWEGQIGKVYVGGSWKGIPYIRKYVVPANPKTADQVEQRGKFKISQVAASTILSVVVQPYWNPGAIKQSGFNLFIAINNQRVSDNQDFVNILMTKGTYEPIKAITSATYNSVNGDVQINWSTVVENIGDNDDRIMLVVLNKTFYDPADKTPILLFKYTELATRADGSESFTFPTGLTPADLIVYLGVRQPAIDPKLRIGNSLSQACVAL